MILPLVCLITISSALPQPAHAQYYQPEAIEEHKPQALFCYHSGQKSAVSPELFWSDNQYSNESEQSPLEGILAFVISLTAAAIAIPIFILAVMRLALASGYRRGVIVENLDSPLPPTRWYDPNIKHHFEMVNQRR
jgi:hypothetical protein